MSFSSSVFIFLFLPVVLLGNFVLKNKYRNIWLLLCSLFFYAWAQPKYIVLLLVVILVDYSAGLLIQSVKFKKSILAIAVILNLLVLLYFKYVNFFIENINQVFHTELNLLQIILPIGVSFYTFKGISYVVDVYRKEIKAEKNIILVALYIAMFPQVLSGPIDRYGKLQKELRERNVSLATFKKGIELFIIGLAQKAILADALGKMVDEIWAIGAGSISLKTAWIGSIAYSLQIYLDFAGYSNMAIGIGKMLGFDFSINFNLPYMAKSITEFWRKWHITLGEWFKQYVYIPLGGNRKGKVRLYINLAIVFLLTGIWHGASWTFILWGVLHGVCRLIEQVFCSFKKSSQKKHQDIKEEKHIVFAFIKNAFGHLYLLFVVNLGWVLFRAPDLKQGIAFIKSMCGILSAEYCGLSVRYFLTKWNMFVLVVAILVSTSIPRNVYGLLKRKLNEKVFIVMKDMCYLALFLLALISVVTSSYQSFIYFQF